MNPFNWNGPEFLVFYLILAVALVAAQVWTRRTREAEAYSTQNTPPLNDPYLVSYLAGGLNGLIRCVTVSLLERNVLSVTTGKKKVVTMDPQAYQQVQSPLEGAVARFFANPHPASEVFKSLPTDPAVTSAGDQYRRPLESAGLLPTPAQRSQNINNALITTLVLASVAIVKLYLANQRGHRNIGFLVILGFVACLTALVMGARRKTGPGKRALQDLKQLFGGLKDRARSGAFEAVSPADVAFVAAVFGLGALGGSRTVYAKELFPAGSASSSGCGSGCGSGGGGCGGGGCGGCGGGS